MPRQRPTRGPVRTGAAPGRGLPGRPTELYFAERLTRHCGGAKEIYFKREDLLHTGAHKINNALGQVLLARRMGKKRIIAETGAGQHGVATAATCAKFGLECVIYMGEVDMQRQALNVFRMRLMGAEVRGVEAGQRTLKEAINEAMRDWVTNVRTTHYVLGTVYGAHPYPMMVRDFHRVIGLEAKAQILAREGRLPDELIACVGGGSDAMGLFSFMLNFLRSGCGGDLYCGTPLSGRDRFLAPGETDHRAHRLRVIYWVPYPHCGALQVFPVGREPRRSRVISVTHPLIDFSISLLTFCEVIRLFPYPIRTSVSVTYLYGGTSRFFGAGPLRMRPETS